MVSEAIQANSQEERIPAIPIPIPPICFVKHGNDMQEIKTEKKSDKVCFVPNARSYTEDATDDIYGLLWACK
jgi:hypothetical protein